MENANKAYLIEQLIRRLMEYNGRKEFTEWECNDIQEILLLLGELDPNGEFVHLADGFDIGIEHKSNVIPFKPKDK